MQLMKSIVEITSLNMTSWWGFGNENILFETCLSTSYEKILNFDTFDFAYLMTQLSKHS